MKQKKSCDKFEDFETVFIIYFFSLLFQIHLFFLKKSDELKKKKNENKKTKKNQKMKKEKKNDKENGKKTFKKLFLTQVDLIVFCHFRNSGFFCQSKNCSSSKMLTNREN